METKQAPALSSAPSREVSLNKEVQHQQQEMAGIAVAASARAEVETAYALAIKKPRNEDTSRRKILDVCLNLKFAEGAKYKKPQGKKNVGGQWVANFVEGLSIRFAEEALRLWGNIKTMQSTIYDDPSKRVVKITVIDLETNLSYSKEFVIDKTVERKSAVGREVVYERINSAGEKVSIVLATEDEILNKEAALASKTIRNNGLRLIPDYVLTEAMEIIESTVKSGVDKDPDAAKRVVIDNLSKIRVLPHMIEDYLGHPLDIISTSEIVELKQVFTTIHEGNATWAEIMEGKRSEGKSVEVVAGGFIPPAQNSGEDAWSYDERVAKERKEFEAKKIFKAGDASTHSHVAKPLS